MIKGIVVGGFDDGLVEEVDDGIHFAKDGPLAKGSNLSQ